MKVAYGFFGKIPSVGDFVKHGLPQGFLAPLDAWWQRVLPGSSAILGEAWVAAWMDAPIWRFAFSPTSCGPFAATGVWMPSTDKVGRLFPLTFAAAADSWDDIARCGGFVEAAERAGLSALADLLTPQALVAAIEVAARLDGDPVAPPGSGMTAWWTAGSPRVPPGRQEVQGLPSERLFASMLDAARF